MRLRRSLPILVVFLFPILLTAQDRQYVPVNVDEILRQQVPGASSKTQIDFNDRLRAMSGAARFSQDYLLGPGDIVEVTVFGIEELKGKALALDSEGKISLPFINSVQLMGLTAREAEVKIGTLYEASVMKNPQVNVTVKEYHSQFVNVLGAVFKPGTYQLTRRAFLVDALAMAGGLLADKAEYKVYVHRAGVPSTSANAAANVSADAGTIEVNLVQLLEKGDISQNVPIYAGDVISVPEKVDRFFYVLGDVNKGGAFEIKKGDHITLTMAIASAGGLTHTAKGSKAAIMRASPDGATKQIPVDIKGLLKGKLPDVDIVQNDVIFVPGSTTKTIADALRTGLGGVLSSVVYGGIVR
jgi:polysaccharide biosynthesis/export protein